MSLGDIQNEDAADAKSLRVQRPSSLELSTLEFCFDRTCRCYLYTRTRRQGVIALMISPSPDRQRCFDDVLDQPTLVPEYFRHCFNHVLGH
jgi:hypothetical protein